MFVMPFRRRREGTDNDHFSQRAGARLHNGVLLGKSRRLTTEVSPRLRDMKTEDMELLERYECTGSIFQTSLDGHTSVDG